MKSLRTSIRLAGIGCLLLWAGLSLWGCTVLLPQEIRDKTLTTYFDDEKIIAARYYTRTEDQDRYQIDELPVGQLSALTKKLNSMELVYRSFHTDYFWGGQYGIELERLDGRYLTYDGTRLELRSVSVREGFRSDDTLKGAFLEVSNCDFWEEMKPFFPSLQ